MGNELICDLFAGERKCRVCSAAFIGFGALCETHRAELAAMQRQDAEQANAQLEARLTEQRAERQAERCRE
jgi:hypothetical protein